MLDNLKRILTMLEKASDRLARRCFYNRQQYPEIFFEIEECIDNIRTWIQHNEIFSCLETFYVSLCLFIDELGMLISQLWEICKPKSGKKGINKTRRYQEKNRIFKSINSMIEHLSQYIYFSRPQIAISDEETIYCGFSLNQ